MTKKKVKSTRFEMRDLEPEPVECAISVLITEASCGKDATVEVRIGDAWYQMCRDCANDIGALAEDLGA